MKALFVAIIAFFTGLFNIGGVREAAPVAPIVQTPPAIVEQAPEADIKLGDELQLRVDFEAPTANIKATIIETNGDKLTVKLNITGLEYNTVYLVDGNNVTSLQTIDGCINTNIQVRGTELSLMVI